MTRHKARRLALVGALALSLVTATTAVAGLVSGSLPGAAFTYTSTTINNVDMGGSGVKLKTRAPIDVKTTYTKLAPTGALTGWHYHNGPVIVTVTVGTLTYLDAECNEWDLSQGQSYIESTGEIVNAYLDPEKNSGLSYVEWFTTRLYPAGAADPVPVPAPCTPGP